MIYIVQDKKKKQLVTTPAGRFIRTVRFLSLGVVLRAQFVLERYDAYPKPFVYIVPRIQPPVRCVQDCDGFLGNSIERNCAYLRASPYLVSPYGTVRYCRPPPNNPRVRHEMVWYGKLRAVWRRHYHMFRRSPVLILVHLM